MLRFVVDHGGAVVVIKDKLDNSPVCYMHPLRAPEQKAGMAKVMCDALNAVEERRAQRQQTPPE